MHKQIINMLEMHITNMMHLKVFLMHNNKLYNNLEINERKITYKK